MMACINKVEKLRHMKFRGLAAKDQKKSQLPALELNSQIGPHEVLYE